MGCSGSKEVGVDDDNEVVAPNADAPVKDSSTRARRLSLAVEARSGKGAQAQPAQESPHAEAIISQVGSNSRKGNNGSGGSKSHDSSPDSAQKLHPTRSRRLSHIYTAEQIAQQLAEADGVVGLGQPGGTKAAWEQPEPGAAEAAASPQHRQPSVRVQVACMSRAGCEPGYKKTNQDNCFAFEKYITEDQALFGAMDGHGPNGHFVSGFVKKQLPMLLVNHLSSLGVQDALHSAFLEVDGGLAASNIDCEFSGCTCAVVHLQGRTLTTAWVGDSRMVLGRQKKKGWRSSWEAIDLSTDHKPTQPEEQQRILANHGRVERLVDEVGQPIGPYRVWLEYAWLPGLAMSRALGDRLAHSVGVSSEPQHKQLELTPADKLLVLASDGVWEFITSKEAVDLVGDCETPEEACRLLVDEAHSRWLEEEEGVVDDITAVVVKLVHNEQP